MKFNRRIQGFSKGKITCCVLLVLTVLFLLSNFHISADTIASTISNLIASVMNAVIPIAAITAVLALGIYSLYKIMRP